MIKRQPFNAAEARAAAAADPFRSFQLGAPSPSPEITDDTEAAGDQVQIQPPALSEQPPMIKKKTSEYTPRSGSKAMAAMTALIDGPMTTVQLAAAMDCSPGSVHANISKCLSENLIVRIKDDTGLQYFALPGNEEIPDAKPAQKPAKREPRAVTAEPEPEEPAEEPGFRCGLFSNGDFVIEVGENAIALSADQTKEIMAYLDRMAVPEEGAPA